MCCCGEPNPTQLPLTRLSLRTLIRVVPRDHASDEAPATEVEPGHSPTRLDLLAGMSPPGVLNLQRQAGNAATIRFLSAWPQSIARRQAESGGSTAQLAINGHSGFAAMRRAAATRRLQRSAETAGQPGNRPNLDVGDTGPGVTLLQRLLGINQSGVFDDWTHQAVIAFQSIPTNDLLPATGGVGPGTWARLDALAAMTGGTLVVGGQTVGEVREFTLGGAAVLGASGGSAPGGTVARRTLARLADPTGKFAFDIAKFLAEGEGVELEEAVIAAEEVVVLPAAEAAAVGAGTVVGVVAAGVIVGVGLTVGVPFVIARAKDVKKRLGELGGTSLPGGLPQPQPQTIPRPVDDSQGRHRGNMHVQGDDVDKGDEPNVAWNQPIPKEKASALVDLKFLKDQCTRSQLRARTQAFAKAERFIQNTVHTAPPPLFRSFFDDAANAKNRVDIEIIEGTAFA